MSRVVRKYTIRGKSHDFVMPQGATVLGVEARSKKTGQLFALVDPDAPTETRTFKTVPPNEEYSSNANFDFIGTFLLNRGRASFHVFELLP